MQNIVALLGHGTLHFGASIRERLKTWQQQVTEGARFTFEAFHVTFRQPLRTRLLLQQMEFYGNRSLLIVIISGFFIGAVFSLQIGHIFRIFGAHSLMGAAAAKALSRELSPLVAGFLLAGRAGAAITAEIGTMRVNEQIDAMEAMAVDPVSYLVGPRFLAGILMMPVLVGIFTMMGMIGGTLVGVIVFDVDQAIYWDKILRLVRVADIWAGLQKAFIFGGIITLVACRYGLTTKGGAKGVGTATTNSVVTTLLTLIGVDFVLTVIQVVFQK